MRQVFDQPTVATIVATANPAIPFIVAMARSDPNNILKYYTSFNA